jgi:hypothetical protein
VPEHLDEGIIWNRLIEYFFFRFFEKLPQRHGESEESSRLDASRVSPLDDFISCESIESSLESSRMTLADRPDMLQVDTVPRMIPSDERN